MERMFRFLITVVLLCAGARAEDYCFGFLNAHPERKPIPETQAEEIQKGHLAHMKRMALAGHLLAAGPFVTEGGPRGVVIYRCTSLDEAREWTALDPAVRNKRLTLALHRWRGPDGIGEPLLTQFKADPDMKMNMVRLPIVVARKTATWSEQGLEKYQEEHGRSVLALIDEGKILAAGPWVDAAGNVGKDPESTGVFIFAPIPLEEALAIARKDALVREGLTEPTGYVWMVADGVMPARSGPR